ncbi:hypothetical protein HSR121_0041 [Halapricum desulfuricans]|uniref:Uncharacterized protein n=1 Tax=Halapricum desulfuricans TaxID=2841257 RepID=A0A897MV12_9EURY|nr:hypothetical protein HSR121_0041 [Halapricum desulfuricans]
MGAGSYDSSVEAQSFWHTGVAFVSPKIGIGVVSVSFIAKTTPDRYR